MEVGAWNPILKSNIIHYEWNGNSLKVWLTCFYFHIACFWFEIMNFFQENICAVFMKVSNVENFFNWVTTLKPSRANARPFPLQHDARFVYFALGNKLLHTWLLASTHLGIRFQVYWKCRMRISLWLEKQTRKPRILCRNRPVDYLRFNAKHTYRSEKTCWSAGFPPQALKNWIPSLLTKCWAALLSWRRSISWQGVQKSLQCNLDAHTQTIRQSLFKYVKWSF